MDDYDFDFSKLKDIANDEKVEKIKYYTELKEIEKVLKGEKFEPMEL